MTEFLTKTTIRKQEYVPWIFTINNFTQCLLYAFFEIRMKIWFPLTYKRELFQLSDGGTIALDWQIDDEGGFPLKNSKRPILACVAGLSGGNDNGYLYSMMKKATSEGYKCVVINFRGTAGVKMTSAKFYGSANWEDFKEPIDFIYSKYCNSSEF